MQLFLDTANVELCQQVCEILPIQGITTNPSLIAKEQRQELDILSDLKKLVGDKKRLFAQVVGQSYKEMLEHTQRLVSAIPDLVIKVPVTTEGLRVIQYLQQQNIPTLGTAVYSVGQGALAIAANVDYVAPYVNRIDNLSYDGLQVVEKLQSLIQLHQRKTQVLAASFKSAQQVIHCLLTGCQAVTVSPEILLSLLDNPIVSQALDTFEKDWHRSQWKA